MVLGIVLVNAFHGVGVGVRALLVIELIGIAVKDGKGVNIFAFGCGFWFEFGGFVQQICTLPEVIFAGPVPELMIERHGLSPVRHGTVRIMLSNSFELVISHFIFEGMQQSHRLLKGLLYLRRAGSGERDAAHGVAGHEVMVS